MELQGVDAFGRMTRKSVADAYGKSVNTLNNWAVQGIGPKPYKTPTGGVFYLADEVRSYALSGVAA